MDDGQIIAMLLEHREQGLDELKMKYGGLFRHIALGYLADPSDAEEVVSDLYLALWRQIPPDRPENLKSYTTAILRNLCLRRYQQDHTQKRRSQYTVALEEIAPYLPGGQTPEEVLSAKELARLINRFLSKLHQNDRIAFVRRYYLAETPEEIGKALGKSGHYISVRLHRVREKLRKYLLQEGIAV